MGTNDVQWPVQVTRPEFEGLVRRVETIEHAAPSNAVTASDVSYLKRSLEAFRVDVDQRLTRIGSQVEALQTAHDQEQGGEQMVSRALAVVGALVGLAGVIVAVVSVVLAA